MVSPAVILVYHRVADLANDPFLLAVTPRRFAEHLDVIRTHGVPMRLEDLVRSLRTGKVPARAVAVTFDDGYADNLQAAKPLLERHDIPATVFVTAGQVGGLREFWWDELDRIILQPGRLPGTLRLVLDGNGYEWELGEGSTYTEEAYRRERAWHIERQENPSPRQRLFRDLFARLLVASPAERRETLDDLVAWAGAEPGPRLTHRTLTADELLRLQQGGLVDIGAHTISHPALATLSRAEQRAEIRKSKTMLEQMLNDRVISFAYPHGSGTSETAELVGEAGSCAPARARRTPCFGAPIPSGCPDSAPPPARRKLLLLAGLGEGAR